jgi:hypothetical protein
LSATNISAVKYRGRLRLRGDSRLPESANIPPGK